MMLKEFLIRKGLSYRESEVAELVAQGLPNRMVAERLFVTEKTIKFHLTNIYRKLNLKSRAQLIIWCRPSQVYETSSIGHILGAPAGIAAGAVAGAPAGTAAAQGLAQGARPVTGTSVDPRVNNPSFDGNANPLSNIDHLPRDNDFNNKKEA